MKISMEKENLLPKGNIRLRIDFLKKKKKEEKRPIVCFPSRIIAKERDFFFSFVALKPFFNLLDHMTDVIFHLLHILQLCSGRKRLSETEN